MNKQYLKIGLLCLAIGLILGAVISYAQTPNSTFYISGGIYPNAPTYTFFRDGSEYFAKDAHGQIAYGGTNASLVIQNAINALNNSGSPLPFGTVDGNTLYFKQAVYELDTQITLPRNIRLVGERGAMVAWDVWHGAQLRIASGTSIGCILNITMSVAGQTYIRIEDLVFNGNNASGATGYGIYIRDSKRIAIERCEFRLFADSPIYADNWEVGLIRDSYFHQFDDPAFRSVTWLGAFYFENNDVNSYANDPNLISAIYINGTGSAIFFRNNEIYGANDANLTTSGLRFDMDDSSDPTDQIFLTNNNFGDFEGGNGTELLGYIEGAILLGNRFRDLNQSWAFDASNGRSPVGVRVAYNTITNCDQFQTPPSTVEIDFEGNYGYVTEISGSGTFSSNTSITVDHGLAGTPTSVLTGFNTTGWTSWSWSATSTQITITVETSGTYLCNWRAEFNP